MEYVSVAEITLLLGRAGTDQYAQEDLYRVIEERLQRIAGHLMHNERRNHTLEETILVDEAFTALVKGGQTWENREQFFCSAAKVMRQVLVDHARAKNTQKRGAGAARKELEDIGEDRNDPANLVAISEALEHLEAEYEDAFKVFNLHYFMGWELQEIADEILCVPYILVRRRWALAKSLLRQQLGESAGQDG